VEKTVNSTWDEIELPNGEGVEYLCPDCGCEAEWEDCPDCEEGARSMYEDDPINYGQNDYED
jgi:hypothetical protein